MDFPAADLGINCRIHPIVRKHSALTTVTPCSLQVPTQIAAPGVILTHYS
jgi:hypothetical protein